MDPITLTVLGVVALVAYANKAKPSGATAPAVSASYRASDLEPKLAAKAPAQEKTVAVDDAAPVYTVPAPVAQGPIYSVPTPVAPEPAFLASVVSAVEQPVVIQTLTPSPYTSLRPLSRTGGY